MAREFTPQQKKVIEARDRDILVSAAAGSGKTTVLVERIIQKITDKRAPVDIDRILVVTFTRAAAAEMRERIRDAIDMALEKAPEDELLARQAAFVFHSGITTIDSFCNDLLKNYFHRIGIEPDYRIGDERELSILSTEVLDEIFEEHYATEDGDFLKLIDTYSTHNRDSAVCDMILSLHSAASATPWPDKWLFGLLADYEGGEPEWLFKLTEDVKRQIGEAYDMADSLSRMLSAEAPDHPYMAAVASDIVLLEELGKESDYDRLYELFSRLSFEALSRKKYEDPRPGFKEEAKKKRDAYKGILQELQKDVFFQSREAALSAMKRVAENVRTLVALTEEYERRYLEKKQEKNILDFSDVEHFALDILVDRDTGEPTQTALELREFYDEILIDEYQDSNYLQETILKTISRESIGENNYFMVGDVKQSIYAFRQARPEIFAQKYETFSTEDGEGVRQQRIDLDLNFRSRREIIAGVNEIFRPLMEKSVGGVDYDEAASLKFGAAYYPESKGADYSCELLLAEGTAPEGDPKYDAEGRLIAGQILDLKRKGFMVRDKESGGLRHLRYSDVVILLRGVKGRGAELMETLLSFGIPSHVTDDTGYFETMEVESVLSLLEILDNPRSDIPLAAVMHSAMFGFSDEELALLRVVKRDIPFFEAVFSFDTSWCDMEGVDLLAEKLTRFREFIDSYRHKLSDMPIHALLQSIYAETGYRRKVLALPGGEQRSANLGRLIDLAVEYERTSFKGCFKFVNYIRRLKKYNQDVGTAELVGEDDDAVRIMTIHKSKGLEFPVVFLAGINKRFNLRDASAACVISPSVGMTLSDISADRRIKSKHLYKTYLSKRIVADALGEEMRILYVALTRAAEKLFLVGTYEEDEDFERYADRLSGGVIPYSERIRMRSYADFLYPVILSGQTSFKVKRFGAAELVFDELKSTLSKELTKEDILSIAAAPLEEESKDLDRLLDFSYPKSEISFKTKYSVSELKRRSAESYFEKEEAPVELIGEKDKKATPASGAFRGTVMHRFMEHFDFASDKGIEAQLNAMIAGGRLSEEEAALIDRKRLSVFLESPLYKRMSKAAHEGLLFKEKPFVMGEEAKALLGEYYSFDKLTSDDASSMLLVQGIIDAFFVEGDDIVLVDYKTDRVKSDAELIGRYKKQMELYADALERGFSKKVSERIIYSFSLSREVVL